jgi:hypothetical protein
MFFLVVTGLERVYLDVIIMTQSIQPSPVSRHSGKHVLLAIMSGSTCFWMLVEHQTGLPAKSADVREAAVKCAALPVRSPP